MRRTVSFTFCWVVAAIVLLALQGCSADGQELVGQSQVTNTAKPVPATMPTDRPVAAIPTTVTPTTEPTPRFEAIATPTRKPAKPTTTPTLRPTATIVLPTSTSTTRPTTALALTTPPREEPRLIIPALNVDAVVVPVGLDANGAMAAPEDWFEIGWFRYGPRPGFAGSAALAGHLDTNTGAPATFWDLSKLVPGQEVVYQSEDGSRTTFVVDEVATYPWDEVPLERVFARSGEPRLALITCGGQWSREHRNYSHRTIVYASLP
jgi:sortase (surface protein transpeptidase)